MFNRKFPETLPKGPPHVLILKSYGENKSLLGKNYVESRRKVKMKSNKLTGPGNISKGLGVELVNDGEDLFNGSINLAPRIHPAERAIATKRKNAKPGDNNLWRFSLVQK